MKLINIYYYEREPIRKGIEFKESLRLDDDITQKEAIRKARSMLRKYSKEKAVFPVMSDGTLTGGAGPYTAIIRI